MNCVYCKQPAAPSEDHETGLLHTPAGDGPVCTSCGAIFTIQEKISALQRDQREWVTKTRREIVTVREAEVAARKTIRSRAKEAWIECFLSTYAKPGMCSDEQVRAMAWASWDKSKTRREIGLDDLPF